MFLGLNSQEWLQVGISLGIVLAVIVLGRWVVRVFLDQVMRRLVDRTRSSLDNTLLEILRLPVYLFAIVLSADLAYQRLAFLPERWESWSEDLFFVLYLLVGFYFAARFLHQFLTWYGREMAAKTETDLDKQLLPFFRRVAMIIVWMIALITVLGHFEVDVSAMVTTLGIGSLAIALAAQEALSDTISGFIIMIDRPFRIGDRIEIQALDTWGDVIDIGLRSSRIRTRDNRMVIVPNSVIGKNLVVNYSYPDTTYRSEVHVGVAYGTDIEKARRVLVSAVEKVEGVLAEQPVEALFLEFGDSALIFRVRWWLDSYVDTRRMFDRVNSGIYKALNEAGIEIPYPQLAVHYKNGSIRPGAKA